MTQKIRIDQFLVQEGYFDSRERAKRAIMAGLVFVDRQIVDKAGTLINTESEIDVKPSQSTYVSRGGTKLAKAIEIFAINLEKKVCLDIGSSTGGFTDCMLQNNAQKVFSIDVGYGQLAWKLRKNTRVVSMERTNIRYVTTSQIGELADFASIDVSFISLKLVLPVVQILLHENAEIVALIKPQFEVGKGKVGKKGVVKDFKIHEEVILKIIEFAEENCMGILNLTYSPLKGPKGNIEYLLHIKNKSENTELFNKKRIVETVTKSHETDSF
ncbi:MAG: TlyA family RNA methyltransferase [Alkaliphilus sp.]